MYDSHSGERKRLQNQKDAGQASMTGYTLGKSE